MENILMYLLFIAGILMIVKGGDKFVDGAVWIAEVTGVPKFIIGATIVSIATTLPEIIVSSLAAFEAHEIINCQIAQNYLALSHDKVGMAVGNGVGSVICNTGLILALSMIFMPSYIDRKKFTPKAVLFMTAVILIYIFILDGSLAIYEAIIMIAIFILYIYENIISAKEDKLIKTEHTDRSGKLIIKNIFYISSGAFLIVFGSDMLVSNAAKIAGSIGISEAVIGVTMVAVGTSLPELVTAVTALIKKEASVSAGNIIGANIIDTALIMPLCTIIYGGLLPVSKINIMLDYPVCIICSAIALLPTVFTRKFSRWQGIIIMAIYLFYLYIISFKSDDYLSFIRAIIL